MTTRPIGALFVFVGWLDCDACCLFSITNFGIQTVLMLFSIQVCLAICLWLRFGVIRHPAMLDGTYFLFIGFLLIFLGLKAFTSWTESLNWR